MTSLRDERLPRGRRLSGCRYWGQRKRHMQDGRPETRRRASARAGRGRRRTQRLLRFWLWSWFLGGRPPEDVSPALPWHIGALDLVERLRHPAAWCRCSGEEGQLERQVSEVAVCSVEGARSGGQRPGTGPEGETRRRSGAETRQWASGGPGGGTVDVLSRERGYARDPPTPRRGSRRFKNSKAQRLQASLSSPSEASDAQDRLRRVLLFGPFTGEETEAHGAQIPR